MPNLPTSRWTSCRVRRRRGLTSSGSVIRPLQQIPPRNGRCVSKTHTLVAVAEELSLTKAAQKLHLAQPSLTRQVRNLEEEIGVAAAGSSQQPVALTGEGRFFLSAAKRLLSMCAESVDAVQRMNRGERSQLNIGYVSNLHYGLLPATLGAFRKLSSDVALNLFDMRSAEQFQALDDRQATMPVAVPVDLPLAKKPKIKLADLAPQTLHRDLRPDPSGSASMASEDLLERRIRRENPTGSGHGDDRHLVRR